MDEVTLSSWIEEIKDTLDQFEESWYEASRSNAKKFKLELSHDRWLVRFQRFLKRAAMRAK